MDQAQLLEIAQRDRPIMVDRITKNCPVLNHLKIVFTTGQNVAWDTLEPYGCAILRWSFYQTIWNPRPLDEEGLCAMAIPMFVRSVAQRDLFTGDGQAQRMAGLEEAIGKTDNVYACIDRRQHAWWRPNVIDPGSPTKLSKAAIEEDVAQIGADLAFVDYDLYAGVIGWLDADGKINGCKFVAAVTEKPDTIYYLSSEFVEFHVLPDRSSYPNCSNEQSPEGVARIPMGMRFEMLSPNEIGLHRACATLSSQLVVKRPNRCGVRRNVMID